MVVITKLIMLGIVVVCCVTLAFILLDFVANKVKNTSSKKINKVHFYVARDKNGRLYLYRGKPFRRDTYFYGNVFSLNFKSFDLNENDYKDLKWEDEPVEVFLNMEE